MNEVVTTNQLSRNSILIVETIQGPLVYQWTGSDLVHLTDTMDAESRADIKAVTNTLGPLHLVWSPNL